MSAPLETAQQEQWLGQCQGLVRSLAVRIHRKLPACIELDDLIAYGELGLVEAAQSFDPRRGCQFSTFAYYRIRGAIYDGAAKMSWGLRETSQESHGTSVARDVDELRSGEDASVPDVGRRLALRRRDQAHTVAVFSLSQPPKDDLVAVSRCLEDTSQAAPSATAMEAEMSEKLHEMVDTLPQAAAALIRATYFEGLTLEEAGRRLGLSKSWASRVRTRALQSLARSLACWKAG